MPDYLVNIVASESGDAEFVPAFRGAGQGQPLEVNQEDLVSWYNQTNDAHQPWQTDSGYNPLAQSPLVDAVPAGQPSNTYPCTQPGGSPQVWTVYYYCNRHPDNPKERGSIIVTALPTNSINIIDSGMGATFTPPARGANGGDLINWNNLTAEAHQPWPTDANSSKLPVTGWPGSLSGVIEPGSSSLVYAVAPPPTNPNATSWTIYYFCNLHPDSESERGTIVVPPPKS
jgi:hypothetical protein